MFESYCGDNLQKNCSEMNFHDSFFQEQTEMPRIDDSITPPLQEIKNNFEKFQNFVKFGHVNAVSVPCYKDEINRILDEIGFDIFAVSESNIHKNTPKSAFEISNYRFFHQDRPGDNKSRGVVAFTARKN